MAQEKSQNEDVKSFGQQLVDDHTKSNEKAEELANSAGVTLPSEMSEEQQQAVDRMKELSGADFDREFLNHMVEGHETAIALFTDKADDADNKVSQFAEETVPVLQQHLDKAKSLMEAEGTAMAPADQADEQDQTATTEEPAATDADEQAATTKEPAATDTEEQAATSEEPAAETGEQLASEDQPADTPDDQIAESPNTATPEQQATLPQDLNPAQPDTVSAETLIGSTVYGPDDESVGEVSDVILAKESPEGKIEAVIIDVGGFLGIGEKPVALAFDDLEIMADSAGNLYVMSKFSQERLEQAPQYDDERFEDSRDEMILRSQD
jgi:hypothetical protein